MTAADVAAGRDANRYQEENEVSGRLRARSARVGVGLVLGAPPWRA